MNTDDPTFERNLRRFILQQGTEAERAELESQSFEEANLADRLMAAEDELAAAYVGDELSADERLQFERRLLPLPRWRAKVDAIAVLTGSRRAPVVGAAPASGHSPVKSDASARSMARRWTTLGVWSMAAATVVAVVGGLFEMRENRRLREIVMTADTRRAAIENDNAALRARMDAQNTAADRSSTASSSPGPLATIALSPGVSRDISATPPVSAPSAPNGLLVIRLAFAEAGRYEAFRVDIETVEGRVIWTQQSSLPRPAMQAPPEIVVTPPSSALPPGDYIVRLRGSIGSSSLEIVASYYFRVTRR